MTPVEERIDPPVFVPGIGPPLSQIREDYAGERTTHARDIVALIDAYLALLTEHSAREELLTTAADALHDAAWVMSGEAKASPPLPPPVTLVLPQTKRVEAEIRAVLPATESAQEEADRIAAHYSQPVESDDD